jgi:hypothetical protein
MAQFLQRLPPPLQLQPEAVLAIVAQLQMFPPPLQLQPEAALAIFAVAREAASGRHSDRIRITWDIWTWRNDLGSIRTPFVDWKTTTRPTKSRRSEFMVGLLFPEAQRVFFGSFRAKKEG